MEKVVIVGASSGIARAVTVMLMKKGASVLLAGRNLEEINVIAKDLKLRFNRPVYVGHFEALEYSNHQQCFEDWITKLGGLDGIILSYGYLGNQSKAQYDFVEAKKILDINFTSCVSLINIAANYLEEKRRGFICAISSVAGDRGRQSNYIYGSSKAALSVYLDGLRNRLYKAEVSVLTVKPGFVDTQMTYGMNGLFLVAKPEKVAEVILRALSKKKHTVYAPFFWKYIMTIIRLIPGKVFVRLSL